MNMLTRGQLRVNMDVGGSDDPLADFSHAFDRLTMGIVIAGLFIGSSIIYFAGVKPLVFGIPIVGFIGFMVAFILGVRLVVDILREGHRHK
jgi:ubiquinone biosynthesis protein